jgi:hypothetical protein
MPSIAADAIACRLSCWRAGQLSAYPRGGARARAGSGGSASYKINTKKIKKKNPEDNKFIPVFG